MRWDRLLDTTLLGEADRVAAPNRPMYAQDYDRIVFSAPFRRLANKTQVHPLSAHDHIHNRLIHSVETNSVGRSLGIEAGQWLEEEGHLEPGAKHVVSGVVQAACAAHDIGNPPFGHSGEAAIGAWFADRFAEGRGIFAGIAPADRAEFERFEGNAQGFRLITRLEMYRNDGGMRLSHATLGAFTKYPALAATAGAARDRARDAGTRPYKGLAKFGIFRAEMPLFEQVAARCGLLAVEDPSGRWWRRHPLVFLVEAADDICYNILDLEDAYVAGDLGADQVKSLLGALFGGTNRDVSAATGYEEITYYRARSISASIRAAVAAFIANYDSIMAGSFSASLVSRSEVAAAFAEIEATARSRIFNAPRKTQLEVTGRNILHRVLSGVLPVYEDLKAQGWDAARLSDYHRQLAAAAEVDLRDVGDDYSALHSLADYVSGMTDRYAVRIADMLSGRMG
ncbi:deoxyguanosinetriphosphate triphosphohydrolase [Celeribacter indicus]|uniref:Deoxyguanosinetriphosphate triphosphohydrolase n=2 Tax=Celeribacter indicus TaxID=1208324 RepID=A0A0B5DZF8_9RHOB|nr:deoxyguanosinetriphosphate triphosphohydrolase [Celeribacter indicus]